MTGRRRTWCSSMVRRGLVERVVGADRDHLTALGERADGDLVGVLPLRDDLDHDVPVGQHPLEAVVLPADGQGADVQGGHPLGGRGDGVVLGDALGALGHDVTRCAGHLSSFGRAEP